MALLRQDSSCGQQLLDLVLPVASKGWPVQRALLLLLEQPTTQPSHAARIREALRAAVDGMEEHYDWASVCPLTH